MFNKNELYLIETFCIVNFYILPLLLQKDEDLIETFCIVNPKILLISYPNSLI